MLRDRQATPPTCSSRDSGSSCVNYGTRGTSRLTFHLMRCYKPWCCGARNSSNSRNRVIPSISCRGSWTLCTGPWTATRKRTAPLFTNPSWGTWKSTPGRSPLPTWTTRRRRVCWPLRNIRRWLRNRRFSTWLAICRRHRCSSMSFGRILFLRWAQFSQNNVVCGRFIPVYKRIVEWNHPSVSNFHKILV